MARVTPISRASGPIPGGRTTPFGRQRGRPDAIGTFSRHGPRRPTRNLESGRPPTALGHTGQCARRTRPRRPKSTSAPPAASSAKAGSASPSTARAGERETAIAPGSARACPGAHAGHPGTLWASTSVFVPAGVLDPPDTVFEAPAEVLTARTPPLVVTYWAKGSWTAPDLRRPSRPARRRPAAGGPARPRLVLCSFSC